MGSPFLEFTSRMFEEALPGGNTFVVATTGVVPAGVQGRVIAVTPGIAGISRVRKFAREADILIVHLMGLQGAAAFAASPAGALRMWSGWGADYYGTFENPSAGLLAPLTRGLVDAQIRSRGVSDRIKDRVRAKAIRAAAARAELVSFPIPEDWDVFCKRFPEFRGQYHQLNYASLEDSFLSSSRGLTGDGILVGNSGAPTNNHLDVLERLAEVDDSDRTIVVPLNYGGESWYVDRVIARGRELFGSRFAPLTEFIPLKDYLEVVSGCSVMVMGQRRQQAIGNLGAALYQGAHVVVDSQSPVARFLKNRSGVFLTLDGLEAGELPRDPLGGTQRERNRELVREFWGRERVLENVRALLRRWEESAALPAHQRGT